MPNEKVQVPNPTVSNAKLERKLRLSLPEKEKSPMTSTGIRRNTISDDPSPPRTKKKLKARYTSTIPEDEDEMENQLTFNVEVEKKSGYKLSRSISNTSKTSAVSTKAYKSSATSLTFDNLAFEGNMEAIGENRPSSRAPSIQSEVYKEQYCCFSRRTKCERYLLVTVTVLSITVIVLIIVVIILADNGKHVCNMLNLIA